MLYEVITVSLPPLSSSSSSQPPSLTQVIKLANSAHGARLLEGAVVDA